MSDEGFPQFAKLPPEIQAVIWEKIINVRIVTVCVDISTNYGKYQSRYEEIPSSQDTILIGLKHLPVELHICRLSRAVFLQSWYFEDPKLHTPEHPLGPGHPLEDTSFSFQISAPHGIVPLITYAYPMQARLSFDFNNDTLHIRTRRHVDVSTSLMLTPPLSFIRHAANCPEPPSQFCNYHFQQPRIIGYGATGSTRSRRDAVPFEYCPKMISVNHIDIYHAFEGMYDLPTRVPSGKPPSQLRQECSLRSRKPVWLLGPPRIDENIPAPPPPDAQPQRRCGDRWDPVHTGFPTVSYPTSTGLSRILNRERLLNGPSAAPNNGLSALLSGEEPIDEAHARTSGLDKILRRLRREAGTSAGLDSDDEDSDGGVELGPDAHGSAHEPEVLSGSASQSNSGADGNTATTETEFDDQDSNGGVLLPASDEDVEVVDHMLDRSPDTDADTGADADDEDDLDDDDDVTMTMS